MGAYNQPGPCQHCRRHVNHLRGRQLCWVCSRQPDIRSLYPPDPKHAARPDCATARLPVLRCYPDHGALTRCACGQEWDGCCARCEAEQRRGMVMVAEREGRDDD